MLDSILPTPRKLELDAVELDAAPEDVWQYVRYADLAESDLVRALFAVRTLPSRLTGKRPAEPSTLKIGDLRSTPQHPGFQVLGEEPMHSVTVGAIGQVWQLDIPFLHVADAAAYAAFSVPGWVKVAWEIRVDALGAAASRVTVEVRVDATDEASWEKFARYWQLIGPGSHFIRHALFAGLRRRFGAAGASEDHALPGDALLPDALAQVTQAITIAATPEAIWPWLLQMGGHRAGFYSIDAIDNEGVPSARELHPELQKLKVGQVIPATRNSPEGFEVLVLEPAKLLVLGGLFDAAANHQLPFANPRPARYWQITWAFVLTSFGPQSTRLEVRARAAFAPSERLHAAWIRPVHSLMQASQLRNLAARAEGRMPRDTLRDVAEGTAGAAIMAFALFTPFLRGARSHWGLTKEEAALPRAGDEQIPEPLWSWTHAVTIEAAAAKVWPWVAQLGADRAGFYSYQWLENLVGCEVSNAEAVHPEWTLCVGDHLVLHPKMPPLQVASVEPGRSLVVVATPDAKARAEGRPWAAASWAFLVEPLGSDRCRVVSRFRSACSDDLATRLVQGPLLLEPIGFAMDRRMLLGIRDRVIETNSTEGGGTA
jgi:hypothetical protein